MRNQSLNVMISLTYCEIPAYLHNSDFYEALCADTPSSAFEIPSCCYLNSDDINNADDLERIFKVLKFWGAKNIPRTVLEFCYTEKFHNWEQVAVGEPEFQVLTNVGSKKKFTLQRAIVTGRPEFIRFWLVKNHRESVTGRYAIAQASRHGRLDLVRILRKKHFPWDSFAYCAAAQYSHLHVLRYLQENGCPLDYRAMVYAAHGGQLECMKYLHSIHCPWHASVTQEYAICNIDHSSFSLIKGSPSPWTDDYTIKFPEHGYVECLLYALENGCPTNKNSCTIVVEYGLMDCLKLLHQYGAAWDLRTTSTAAEYGRLDCLEFLHENDCPWDGDTTKNAAINGQLNCLRYARNNGCPYSDSLLIYAARATNPDCLQFLIEESGLYMRDNGLIFDSAFYAGKYANIQYLLDVGCPTSKVALGKFRHFHCPRANDACCSVFK